MRKVQIEADGAVVTLVESVDRGIRLHHDCPEEGVVLGPAATELLIAALQFMLKDPLE